MTSKQLGKVSEMECLEAPGTKLYHVKRDWSPGFECLNDSSSDDEIECETLGELVFVAM
jgi:hypothetical protein